MNLGKACTRDVVFAARETTPAEIAVLMRTHHVGDVVIADERDGRRFPLGIVTDRDLVIELIAEGVELATVTATDFMSDELVTGSEDEDLWDALERMRVAGVRRLAVIDGAGALVGVLSLDDVLELIAEAVDALILATGREQLRERRLRS